MIIFISGSINSGKSTVAALLAKKLGKAALVEIDTLSEFIEWMPIEERVSINLENAVLVIRNFAKRNMDVVVPYPLSVKNYEYMIKALKDIGTSLRFFVLNPSLEVALSQRGERTLIDGEKERIKYHYDTGINNPGFGMNIDSSNLTPQETTEMILGQLSKG